MLKLKFKLIHYDSVHVSNTDVHVVMPSSYDKPGTDTFIISGVQNNILIWPTEILQINGLMKNNNTGDVQNNTTL